MGAHLTRAATLADPQDPRLVEALLQERRALLRQNQALAMRLLAFQRLFRNKDKLAKVVSRLGMTLA